MYDIKLSGCFRNKMFYDLPFEKLPRISDGAEPLVMAIDPSSSQTGIAIGKLAGEVLFFMDFKNLTLTRTIYTTYLNDYLERLARHNKIVRFINEVTYDRSGDDMASVVLRDLEDNFKRYTSIMPDLTKEEMYPILPSVWRKNFLKDKEYIGQKKNRESLKQITRKECFKRYPQYYTYFYHWNAPPDSTDAIGIFHGFQEEYWWDAESGIRRISKINSRYTHNQDYTHHIVAKPNAEIIQLAVSLYGTPDIDVFAFNKDFSVEENMEIVTAQSNKPAIILALDQVSTILLRWSVTEGDPSLDTNTCAIVCKRSNARR